jgi:hypothetical protein
MKTKGTLQANFWLKLFGAGILGVLLTVGCGGSGGGGGSSDGTGDTSGGTTQPVTYLSGNDMLIALDTYGNPIPSALVGENDMTDGNGVIVSDFETTAEGWLNVSAPGFASGYADAVESNGVRVFEIRLTPISASVNLATGDVKTLYIGNSEDPLYSAGLNASDFEAQPVIVSLTSINPIYVLPLFAPLGTGEDLTLQKAFAVEAADREFESIALKGGSTITIRIRDDGALSNDAVLAYFDPQGGQWKVVTGGCVRDGSNHFNCTVALLSPLYGLFDAQDAGYLAGAFQITGDVTDDLGDDWSKANQSVRSRVSDLAACTEAGTCDPTEDPQMIAAVNAMVEAARAYAAANQNEKGKMALMAAQNRAALLGFSEIAQELTPEVEAITNKLGLDYVNNGNCGRITEMLHIERQFQLLGGDANILGQLQQKLEDYFQTCDLWVGRISYYYWNGPSDPCSGDLAGGSGVWIENHHVRIPTHVKTHAVTGEDKVSLAFPEVSFNTGGDCPSTTKTYYGNPSSTTLFLSFDGFYDGIAFSVNTPGPASNPIAIVQKYVMKTKEDDECIVIPEVGDPDPISFPGFSSALVHGFNGSPPITLQEMLESGNTGSYGEYETIRGGEDIFNGCSETNLGRYPFDNGHVTWFFWHEKKVLPVAE